MHLFCKIRIISLLSLLILLLPATPLLAQLSDKDMVVYTPSGKEKVQLFWRDEQDKVLGSLARLLAFTGRKKQKLVFAMNGGMYMEDRAPLGLFIQEGKLLRKLNRAKGYGNFYLMPNGVFYITNDGKGAVCQTGAFRMSKNIRYATQSGPMLVVDGKIHEAFKKGSTNGNVRNGVGILPDGRMLFAMSRKEVNLYDFAEYFKNKGCKNALFLDGFVSRTYLPAANWKQLDGWFGVMIGAVVAN
ncbi:MAG: hypothetical protein EOP49_35035 [Sphingobacteriales bacterium]|nr:MAG: hypothetical protein EOP49_35035 [Sphingobacteriales bacterium]